LSNGNKEKGHFKIQENACRAKVEMEKEEDAEKEEKEEVCEKESKKLIF